MWAALAGGPDERILVPELLDRLAGWVTRFREALRRQSWSSRDRIWVQIILVSAARVTSHPGLLPPRGLLPEPGEVVLQGGQDDAVGRRLPGGQGAPSRLVPAVLPGTRGSAAAPPGPGQRTTPPRRRAPPHRRARGRTGPSRPTPRIGALGILLSPEGRRTPPRTPTRLEAGRR